MPQKKLNNTYIIAETACSHDGSVSRLKKLIRAANDAKADAIQFQVWQGEDIVTPKHKDYKFLKSIELKKKSGKNVLIILRKIFQD